MKGNFTCRCGFTTTMFKNPFSVCPVCKTEVNIPYEEKSETFSLMDREKYIKCFEDTVEYASTNIKDKTLKMIQETEIYSSLDTKDTIKNLKNINGEKTHVSIHDNRTISECMVTNFIHCANEIENLAFVNFANAINPGGGVKHGSPAQEESICRSTNLYLALESPHILLDYYIPNQIKDHYKFSKTSSYINYGSEDCVWIPNVTIFKTDPPVPEVPNLMDEQYTVNCISCAAVDLSSIYGITPKDKLQIEATTRTRIERIVLLAISKNVKCLITGAFGCGAFKNDPKLISRIWKETIIKYNGYIPMIKFAIPDKNSENYKVFKKEFEDFV